MSLVPVLQQWSCLLPATQQCSYLQAVQPYSFPSPAVQLPPPGSPAVQLPPPSSPAVQLPLPSSPGRVGEELIQNCVTPRKVRGVQEALRREKNLYRCALKLVPILFTKAELANSNTDGSHKKGSLDSGRLNSLKTSIFTQFPVTSNEEKEKIWISRLLFTSY